jgi:hypothetical protein
VDENFWSDLLLDGAVLDAANDGDWILVGSVGFVILLAIGLGVASWLKGRKAVAVLVWLLIVVGAAVLLLPLSTVQGIVETSTSNIAWSLIGVAGAALLIGFFSAVRLARPPSWWAQRRYDNDRYAAAIERHQWTRPQAR